MEYATELGLDEGLTAVIGAGGKKSTMYAVAPTLDCAVVTTAVRIPPFEDQVAEFYETRDPLTALESVEEWPVGLAPTAEETRYLGYDFETLAAIADSSIPQAVFVKADGARNRELKVPGEDEPKVPPAADRVLGLASTQVVGKPLTEEYVHRVQRVSDLTGIDPGEELTVEAVATILSSPEGAEHGVPDAAEFIPVLNKVDDASLRETARAIADRVLERGRADRVALTQLRGREEPLVELRT